MLSDSLATQLAAFIVGTRFGSLPSATLPIIRNAYTDCLGVGLAATEEPVVAAVAKAAAPLFADGTARLLFIGSSRISTGAAALINGTAAHALDYDDAALDAHPSAVLVPALLACAQEEDMSGSELVTAFAVGYEVWAELYSRLQEPMYRHGFHPTGVMGSVAAAAALANLLRLDQNQTVHALGLATSFAGGLVANFGTMAKSVHAGRAAENGVIAVRMALAGVTASGTSFEHPQGFLSSYAGQRDVDVQSPIACGRTWRLLQYGLSIKLFPVCYGVHRALHALSGLLVDHPVPASEVQRIAVEIGRSQLIPLSQHRPVNARQARFSTEFAMASMLLTGQCGLAQLQDTFVASPQVAALMRKVEIIPLDEKDAEEPVFSPYDKVTLHLASGSRLESAALSRPPGHISAPVTPEQLWSKFSDCLAHLDNFAVPELFDVLQHIDQLPALAHLPVLQLPDRFVLSAVAPRNQLKPAAHDRA
ncbi:MAG: MmgE/PrpD family protein [Pigmentiphaga sp.]